MRRPGIHPRSSTDDGILDSRWYAFCVGVPGMTGGMAVPLTRVGDMEIGEDFDFQKREWVVERVAWVVMVLIIAGAFVGVFGHGPIANASVGGEDDPLHVSYPRIDRKISSTSWEVTVASNTARNGQIEFWVATSYLDRFAVEAISPEPVEMRAGADRVVYVFQVNDPAEEAAITFEGEFHTWGVARARVGLVDGLELSFRQVIYP